MAAPRLLCLLLLACMTGCASHRDVLKTVVTRPPFGQGTAPVLQSISFHTAMKRYLVIYPEFHFDAADGNVVAIHREIVSSTATQTLDINQNAIVAISSDQQRRGAIFVGGWSCGPEPYAVVMRAFFVDANGNHSNALDYTIDCTEPLSEHVPGRDS